MIRRALGFLIAAAAAFAALAACSTADTEQTADAQPVQYDDHGHPYYQAGEFRVAAELPGTTSTSTPSPTRDAFPDDCYVQDPSGGWHLMTPDPESGEYMDSLVGILPKPGTDPGPDWRPTDRPLCAPGVTPAHPD